MRVGVPRVDLDRTAVAQLRLVHVEQELEEEAEVVPGRGVRGIELEGAAVERLRLVQPRRRDRLVLDAGMRGADFGKNECGCGCG